MQYYIGCLKKYACFAGRARRKEYWMFVLFNFLASLIAFALDAVLTAGFAQMIYGLAVLLPSIAVTARRLHDTSRTGWWMLIGIIPFIGYVWLLILVCLEGNSGDNKYGPDPKAA